MSPSPADIYDEVHAAAERIVAQLTFDEKVALLSGRDLFRMAGASRVKLPYLKTSDGPSGIRGGKAGLDDFCDFPFFDTKNPAPKTAMFPAACSLACTWSTEAASKFGAGIARDGLSKGAHLVLAPTINAVRDPRNGRSFETLAEDPLLAGRLASHWTSGAQDETGVLVCYKHLVCNECETDRRTSDVLVEESVLRELYLRPFEIAIKDLEHRNKMQPGALMTSYNAINGVSCSNNRWLLDDVVRKEWDFKGVVLSDWNGTYRPASETMTAGLDLEMPGPPRWRTSKAIQDALDNGTLSPAVFHTCVTRVVEMIVKSQKFAKEIPFYLEEDTEKEVELSSDPTDAEKDLHRYLGAEGSVLLKNDDALLPLDTSKIRRVVVVGDPAIKGCASGGGSANMPKCYETSPIKSLQSLLPSNVTVEWQQGRRLTSQLPLPTEHQLSGEKVVMEWFDGDADAPVHTEECPTVEVRGFVGGYQPPSENTVIRTKFALKPSVSGEAKISLESFGDITLTLTCATTGKVLIDKWQYKGETDTPAFMFNPGRYRGFRSVTVSTGQTYNVSLMYRAAKASESLFGLRKTAFRLGFQEYIDEDAILLAAREAAKTADVAIVFTATGREYEGEGQDRESISLPRDQQGLVAAIAAAAPGKTVVVNQSGAAVEMDFADDPAVSAILQTWFGGIELGNMIAEVLLGHREPGGRMAATWPKRIEDHPSYGNFPTTPELVEEGSSVKPVRYAEGMLYGHRWYEAKKLEPRWWFGHGLSYTTWRVDLLNSELRMSADLAAEIDVSVWVLNTGARKGKQVVQLYDLEDGVRRLVGFTDVPDVQPRESRQAAIRLTGQAISRWDQTAKKWTVKKGVRELVVALSADPNGPSHLVRVAIE